MPNAAQHGWRMLGGVRRQQDFRHIFILVTRSPRAGDRLTQDV